MTTNSLSIPTNRFSFKALTLSLGLTTMLFFIPPLIEVFRPPISILELRPVDSILPPPPMAKPKIIPPVAKPKTPLPSPKPSLQNLPSPSPLDYRLDLDIDAPGGDFSLNFNLNATPGLAKLVFEIEEVDTKPKGILQISPQYPFQAKRKGIQGEVHLVFTVNERGIVQDILVKHSSPPGVFDRSAIAAVKKWKFEPGKKDGQPVSTKMFIPLDFELEGGS